VEEEVGEFYTTRSRSETFRAAHSIVSENCWRPDSRMLKVLIMFAPNPLKNPSNPSFFHVLSKTAKMAFLLFLSGPVDFVALEAVEEP
jgi:hypothetical protein